MEVPIKYWQQTEVLVLSFADNSGGQLIQTVNTTRVDVVSGTTTMPFDDTIPQKTEGVEFLTVAITPTKNDNKLLISVHLQCQMTNNGQWSMALFQDDTADALAAFFRKRWGLRSRDTFS